MATKLGTLVLELRTRSQRFIAGMRGSTKQVNALERSSRKLQKTLLLLGGTTGMGLIIKRSLEMADSIAKTADAADISTRKLQELRFAGERSGVSMQQVDDGLRRFTRRLGLAADGMGPAIAGFKQLSINTVDLRGNIRPTEQVLNEVIRALGQLDSAAERSALASQFFGDDAGPKLALLLAQGEKGIDNLAKEAEKMGIILDNDLIRNAEKANDAFEDLQKVFGANLTRLVTSNAKELESFGKSLIEVVAVIIKASAAIIKFTQSIGTLFARIQGFNAEYQSRSMLELDTQNLAEAEERLRGLHKTYQIFLATGQTQLAELIRPEVEFQLRYVQELIKQTESTFKQSVNSLITSSRVAGGQIAEGLFGGNINNGKISRKTLEEERAITHSFLEQLEKEHQGRLTAVHLLGLEERIQIEKDAASKRTNLVLGNLQSMTAGVAQHSKTMFKINKAAAIADAAINIPAAASGAYKWGSQIGGPALGAAMAAVAVGAQVASLNAIKNTSFGGGGAGIPPSQAATPPTIVQPAEQTEITERFITVNLLGQTREEEAQQLIETINLGLGNGVVLRTNQ